MHPSFPSCIISFVIFLFGRVMKGENTEWHNRIDTTKDEINSLSIAITSQHHHHHHHTTQSSQYSHHHKTKSGLSHSQHRIMMTNSSFSQSRHKRTHDRGDGVEGNFNLSGEDEEEYSGEDQFGSLEEASPTSESGYVPSSLNSVANGATPTSNPMGPSPTAVSASAFNSLQTLSMPMTISQPQAINAGGNM
jgi:hypothetical protein